MPKFRELKMVDRWKMFLECSGAQDDGLQVYACIAAAYTEPHRKYHTLEHIAYCLDELDEARVLAIQPNIVEYALWMHDYVYDTRASDNEEQSASIAHDYALRMGLSAFFAQRAREHILATKNHIPGSNSDSELVLDIDLSILGAAPAEFDAYDKQIRGEYGWVPQFIFNKRRKKVLSSFLVRPRIYYTDYFYKKYEAAARDNLKRAVDRTVRKDKQGRISPEEVAKALGAERITDPDEIEKFKKKYRDPFHR